ncbi:hypothetical protein SAMN04489725_1221 [Alicyclobacillus hesperidum]|uniref:Uncharacterized protein n=1 Tax=Alicyclobacillus hesperidum TaxID=89784 RepID=A0A1H2XLL7_9BACL|nr:hypothetical protein SAMN04489725_1221 [Alicyclobacillus hesperidum]
MTNIDACALTQRTDRLTQAAKGVSMLFATVMAAFILLHYAL